MKPELERLLAMLCNKHTDREAYEFVLRQLLELLNEE